MDKSLETAQTFDGVKGVILNQRLPVNACLELNGDG